MSSELSVLRAEKKYGLALMDAQRMEQRLRATLHPDAHDKPGGYLVRSLYFDTIDDTDYHEKVQGYELRRKVRLRVYAPDAAFAKLELKQKQGEAQQKRSLTLCRADAERLCEGDYSPLLAQDTPFASQMYARMTCGLYRPAVVVEYDRTAFAVPANDIRVTLDRRLRATEASTALFSPTLATYPVVEADSATLEVKYNGFLLSYVKDLLGLHGYPQSSISKYCAARSVGMRGET